VSGWRAVRRDVVEPDCVETLAAVRFVAGPLAGTLGVEARAGAGDEPGDLLCLYDVDGVELYLADCLRSAYEPAPEVSIDWAAWDAGDTLVVEPRP